MPSISKYDSQKILGTLRNQLGTAEGSLLPPPQQGAFRVPFVTNLRLLQTTPLVGSTQFVIGFNEPTTSQDQIDHYNIFIGGLTGNINQLSAPVVANASPVTVTVPVSSTQILIFKVQTVLKNGLVSDLLASPTCTGSATPSAIGVTATITLAKITGLGSNGSLTIANGIITSAVAPT